MKIHSKLLAAFLALLLAALPLQVFAFSDTAGHWAEADISTMTEKGYLSGYPDGTFQPDKTISRAEFMKIITAVYGLVESGDSYLLWADVDPSAWYAPYTGSGLLMPLYQGLYLYPEEPLTRRDAVHAILPIHGIVWEGHPGASAQGMADYAEYKDDPAMCSMISAAIDNNIMLGKDTGFAPFDYLTRAELCTLLRRLDGRTTDTENLNGIINGILTDVLAQAGSAPLAGVLGEVTGYSGEYEKAIFDMVNQVRAENGLAALAWDDGLAALARAHSEDMIKRGFFDHVNPDGLGPDGRADAAGISYYMISENISAGDASPEVIMDGWMNSPGHRGNILDPEATRLGVGVVLGGELGVYWTQCFAG